MDLQPGWLGVWLFVGSSAVIVIEVAIVAVWSMRLTRRTRALSVAVQEQRGMVEADLARLRAAVEETRRLWQPYRRVLRVVRHPLAIALLASYRRRWAAGRLL
jgi:hypothetical protein